MPNDDHTFLKVSLQADEIILKFYEYRLMDKLRLANFGGTNIL
jgi:hypothetical protein